MSAKGDPRRVWLVEDSGVSCYVRAESRPHAKMRARHQDDSSSLWDAEWQKLSPVRRPALDANLSTDTLMRLGLMVTACARCGSHVYGSGLQHEGRWYCDKECATLGPDPDLWPPAGCTDSMDQEGICLYEDWT